MAVTLGPVPAAPTSPRLRVALFGTPSFALPVLDALHARHDVRLVVAQPDRPTGRDRTLTSPPVAARALALGLPLAQPDRLRRDVAFAQRLAALELDVAVTAAYGQILPAALLALPREGFLNVHASLLPRWRGAAPVQRALIAGDTVTGVTIMQTEAGLDTGPIRSTRAHPIAPTDDAASLLQALSWLGAETLLDALELLAAGRLPSTAQDDALATHAPRLDRSDGRIRWTDSAEQVRDRHRGVAPWPGTWCTVSPDGASTALKIHALAIAPDRGNPSEVLAVDADGVLVACGAGAVRLTEVQPAGRPRMPARAWANGARIRAGDHLG